MIFLGYRIYVFSALIVVCILVATGCERIIEATIEDEIVFSPSLDAEVKGYELISGSLLDFGVYATLEDDGVDFNDSENLESFMDNVLVEKSLVGESVVWVSTPKYYWPMIGGKNLSFFCICPI